MKRALKLDARNDQAGTWKGPPIAPAAAAMPVHPQPRTVRRAELLAALKLPANARLQFGGREWLQDFDGEACLIVTVPR